MKIIIAPDSFKGTLTALEAAKAIQTGVMKVCPDIQTVLLPVGDGGEGTVSAIASSLPEAREITVNTIDPLGRPIKASYITDGTVAYIESAAASGLNLIPQEDRDIVRADTRGTGLMMADAFRRGIRRFFVGMGGTATCDGGYGCLREMQAHGVKDIDITLLCDVKNPLCGPQGAAAVFGPQKGATPDQIPMLDNRLRKLASIYKEMSGIDVVDKESAGAAGGLAGMMIACFGAKPVSGISKVLELLKFESYLEGADLVITGEGRADATTLSGKAPTGILKLAARKKVPVYLAAGQIIDENLLLETGFDKVIQVTPSVTDPSFSYADYLTIAISKTLYRTGK